MTSHRTLREGLSIVYLIYIYTSRQPKGGGFDKSSKTLCSWKKEKKNEVSQEKEKKKSRTRQEGREKEE
jgi:hypothetical protein